MTTTEDNSSGACIVLLPYATDPIHAVSTEEPSAHQTLVWLGDAADITEEQGKSLVDVLTALAPFMEPVCAHVIARTSLGAAEADVVLTDDTAGHIRDTLLNQPVIWDIFTSTEQFPSWTPHVTLGYPDKPSPLDPMLDYTEEWIDFNRLALWNGTEVYEFQLGPGDPYAEQTAPAIELPQFDAPPLEGAIVADQEPARYPDPMATRTRTRARKPGTTFSTALLSPEDLFDAMEAADAIPATTDAATEGGDPLLGATKVTWSGPIGVEGLMTGDKRIIQPEALRWNLPFPLRYVSKDVGAHDGAEVVGRCTEVTRVSAKDPRVAALNLTDLDPDATLIWGDGDFDLGSAVGREAARQVVLEYTTGVSMDLDDVAFEVLQGDEGTNTLQTVENEVMSTTDARVRASTIVAIPAFAEATIRAQVHKAEAADPSVVTESELLAAGGTSTWAAKRAAKYAFNPTQWRNPDNGKWIDMPGKSVGDLQEFFLNRDSDVSFSPEDMAGLKQSADRFGQSLAEGKPDLKPLDNVSAGLESLSQEAYDAGDDELGEAAALAAIKVERVKQVDWSKVDTDEVLKDALEKAGLGAKQDDDADAEETEGDAEADAADEDSEVTAPDESDAAPEAASEESLPANLRQFIEPGDVDDDGNLIVTEAELQERADAAVAAEEGEGEPTPDDDEDGVDEDNGDDEETEDEDSLVGLFEKVFPEPAAINADISEDLEKFWDGLDDLDHGNGGPGFATDVRNDGERLKESLIEQGQDGLAEQLQEILDSLDAMYDTGYADKVETFNWVEETGGLPAYIKEVADAIAKKNPGYSEGRSIAIAVNTIKRWAKGGSPAKGKKGHVSAETVAKAAAALAEWEAKKAAAKANASTVPHALVAAAAPIAPPLAWFEMQEPTNTGGPTAITITDDGHIYGHLATYDACHIASPSGPGICVVAPHSARGYVDFHVGAVKTREGQVVPTGPITMNTGHAGPRDSARVAAAHYDHTGFGVADVRATDGRYGIWITGALRPDVTEKQKRVLRASPLSGDWRMIGGGLEMIGALAVNKPGFGVPRPYGLVASAAPDDIESAPELQSLVAAGMIAPKRVLKPGTEGALSREDLGYLKALARREKETQQAEKKAGVQALAAKINAERNREIARRTAATLAATITK